MESVGVKADRETKRALHLHHLPLPSNKPLFHQGGGSSGSSSRSDEDGFRGNKPTMEGGWMDPTAPRNRNPNVELAKKLKQKQDYYARHKSGRYVHEGQFSGGGAGRGDEAAVLHGGAEADSSPVVFWTRYSAWLRQFLLVVPFFVVPVGLLGFVFCTCVDHSMTGFAKKKSQKGKILYDNEGKAYCRDTHGVYRKLSSALDISD